MKQKASCKRCKHLGFKKKTDLWKCWFRDHFVKWTNPRCMCDNFKGK